ncbi:MAG: protein translocase subunit SecD, partial [Gammaproteobacteria bacterium]|nr:protein translocase subunit SecD [Gammaproteobacteria bacterium]
MINQYPLWKYILILSVLFIGALYALPNLYGKDPAVLISPLRAQEMDSEQKQQIEKLLKDAGVVYKGMEDINSKLMVRFADTESQLKASSILGDALANRFVVAQNLAASTPDWLRAINGKPMYLGLDL